LTAGGRGFTAELPDQGEPEIGRELIRIRYADGRVQDLHLHDYEAVYSLPGVYEEIVQRRLGCRSPAELASMLAAAVGQVGWDPSKVRVLDIAAGNGVSGEALGALGLRPVLGTDIVDAARVAARRDRPGVYDSYLTLDLLALSDAERDALGEPAANALTCVAPVGDAASQLPPAALASAARRLTTDALVVYMHNPSFGVPDAVTAEFWLRELGSGTHAEELERRRYVHRLTVGGERFEMDGVVWRIIRG
jgi:hypothetical protein